MAYFLCKLIPPRPTFAQDMTEAEAQVMREHVGYWSGLADKATAIVFGPVADPKGMWGVGILEVTGEEDVRILSANDPAIKSGMGFRYEVYLMPQAILRK